MYAIERIERSARRTIRRNDGANHNPRRSRMNRDRFEGTCKQIRGKLKERLGKLTHDPQREFAGLHEQHAGRIQERYRCLQEQAARQLKAFLQRNQNWAR